MSSNSVLCACITVLAIAPLATLAVTDDQRFGWGFAARLPQGGGVTVGGAR